MGSDRKLSADSRIRRQARKESADKKRALSLPLSTFISPLIAGGKPQSIFVSPFMGAWVGARVASMRSSGLFLFVGAAR
ncbi:hypothetical protein [Paenibacillus sp. 453mf]|uniref:hypothetical protein n=1 Tax=Paenibacillus sp. 453mf TaxID=1761874 RepID=UPI001114473A|nr:hypothetical protein [Paenibacillus sp. 453mf]